MARRYLLVIGLILTVGGSTRGTAQGTDSLVAFHQFDDVGEIYLYNFRTRSFEDTPYLRGGYQPQYAALSANKLLLAYDAHPLDPAPGAPPRDIYLYDRLHSSMRSVYLNTRYNEGAPALSGNGRYLAFQSDRTGHYNIYLY